jgi:hypothetical protein
MMEDLKKSIDTLIDELFAEKVEKAMEFSPMEMPASENDASNPGRPKELVSIPEGGEEGKREGNYDSDISTENSPSMEASKDEKKKEEVKQESPLIGISKSEYAEYLSLKQEKEKLNKSETLEKALLDQSNLIKSMVNEAVSSFRKENEDLRKALNDQNEKLKAIASKPKASTTVVSMAALEKSNTAPKSVSYFSKDELLDAAEALVKSGKLKPIHVVELENNGFIAETEYRAIFEQSLKGKR